MAKIMLVEDDNNLREIYEARLLAEGYEIVAAKDGEEALALAVKEKPDLIISDVMMPKISGFDMLDILRSTPETKNTKVIMMTALSQAEDKARAEKLGADRYLVKSQVTLEDVAKVAKDVLSGDEIIEPTEPAADTPAEATAPPAPEPAQTQTVINPDSLGTEAPVYDAPQTPVMPPSAPAEPPAPTEQPEPTVTQPATQPVQAPSAEPSFTPSQTGTPTEQPVSEPPIQPAQDLQMSPTQAPQPAPIAEPVQNNYQSPPVDDAAQALTDNNLNPSADASAQLPTPPTHDTPPAPQTNTTEPLVQSTDSGQLPSSEQIQPAPESVAPEATAMGFNLPTENPLPENDMAQTQADEAATVDEQISEFINQIPADQPEPAPFEQVQPDGQAPPQADNTADVIPNGLMEAPVEHIEVASAPEDPNVVNPAASSAQPAPVQQPAENNQVTINNKKIISPIGQSDQKPNLGDMLNNDQAQQANTPPASSVISPDEQTITPPNPDAPASPSQPGNIIQPGDPNSIAL